MFVLFVKILKMVISENRSDKKCHVLFEWPLECFAGAIVILKQQIIVKSLPGP